MSDKFAFGDLCYVKLHLIDAAGNQKWLGWLGLGASDGYSTYINTETELPPRNRVLAVQWVTHVIPPVLSDARPERDGSKSGPLHPDSDEVVPPNGPTFGKRYLRAINYPGGPQYLGGSGSGGFCAYWCPGDADGNPITADVNGASYALLESPGPTPGVKLVTRQSDQATIYTYNDYYMGFGKSGNEFQITFEFIPAAQFTTRHENWMHDYNRYIGDRSLTQIAIPGSHDAGCTHITRVGGSITSKTQSLEILDQLRAGSRYLDLRAWKNSSGVWYIYHGGDWTSLKLVDAADQLATFLQGHPNEVVLVSLLLNADEGTFPPDVKEGWALFFDKLHTFHLDYQATPQSTPLQISAVTPNSMTAQNKNLIVFSWGAALSWTQPLPGGGSLYMSPWPSGPGTPLDREGVYTDNGFSNATAIYNAYVAYNRTAGQCWIFHTNTPWSFWDSMDSLYSKHYRNTPGLTHYLTTNSIAYPKVNIVNIDFVGDVVNNYDLVAAVIGANNVV